MRKIRHDISVILCTGYSNKINDEGAKQIGIDAFAYKPFTKLSDAEKAKRRKIHNRKTYLRRKAEGKTQTKVNKDAAYEFCDFCGGEHKATPAGRSNHRLTQLHTTKVLTNNICNYYIKKHSNVKTMEQAERALANLIKNSEASLGVKYTPITLKNKYKRLWAQYSCN